MGLDVAWYDFVCFGIVGVAVVGSLWVLWRKEGACRRDGNSLYESLLVGRPESSDGSMQGSVPKSHVGSAQLWTSCWRGVHPGWLFGTRLCSCLVMIGFMFQDIDDWGVSVYMYYTEWTFSLVMIYFAVGSVVSAYGCWSHYMPSPSANGTRGEFKRDLEESRTTASNLNREQEISGSKLRCRYTEEEILERAGFWGYLMQSLYQTCAGAVVMTDVVFWCVIVPFMSTERLGLNVVMGCMHTLNAFFLLVDTALNNLPFPWFRFAYFTLWSSIYVIFQWVIHACGYSWWPYPFLILSTPWAALWYFVLAVLHIPCYSAYALIVKAKNSFLPRLCPHCFVRSC
ncbi:hypothetical protein ACJRO7_030272 [Eucalyptus globulus]|uniref:Uncharacterized protein n=3 Tax=Eucalyptus globulus TaxID=34317 RepID=A0ABD3JDY4_EUCGL